MTAVLDATITPPFEGMIGAAVRGFSAMHALISRSCLFGIVQKWSELSASWFRDSRINRYLIVLKLN